MKFAKRLGMALGFVAAATAFRFTSMNSAVDLVTTTLMLMSLTCGFLPSLIGWSLFGVVLEISYLVQGGFMFGSGVILSFVICILTCASIGAAVGGLVKGSADRALLLSPLYVGFAKWLLAFGQDFYLLIFYPAMAPAWLAYHAATEVWALAKIGQAVLWYLPVYVAALAVVALRKRRVAGSLAV